MMSSVLLFQLKKKKHCKIFGKFAKRSYFVIFFCKFSKYNCDKNGFLPIFEIFIQYFDILFFSKKKCLHLVFLYNFFNLQKS